MNEINANFARLLAARGKTPALILQEAGVARSHGHQVLKGVRPGGQSRRKIAKVLTPDEVKALGWDEPGATLLDLLFERENGAWEEVKGMMECYLMQREHMQRIIAVVAAHPEIFGVAELGGNYLQMAAVKLEEIAAHAEKEQVAA